MHQTA